MVIARCSRSPERCGLAFVFGAVLGGCNLVLGLDDLRDRTGDAAIEAPGAALDATVDAEPSGDAAPGDAAEDARGMRDAGDATHASDADVSERDASDASKAGDVLARPPDAGHCPPPPSLGGCASPAPYCCQLGASPGTCMDAESVCTGYPSSCSSTSDCPQNNVCCHYTSSTKCEQGTACPGVGGIEVCVSSYDCPDGSRCAKIDAGDPSPFFGCGP
jgi:hypothetical protein